MTLKYYWQDHPRVKGIKKGGVYSR